MFFTPLCAARNAEMAALLLENGANPGGCPGEEPILVSARTGRAELSRVLLEAGARPLPRALNLANLSGDQPSRDLFMDAGDPGVGVSLAAERGISSVPGRILRLHPQFCGHALLGAIKGCRHELARKMLAMGADPNARDSEGRTPLLALYARDRRRDLYRFINRAVKLRPLGRRYEAHLIWNFCL